MRSNNCGVAGFCLLLCLLSGQAMADQLNCEEIAKWALSGWNQEQNASGALNTGNRLVKALEDEYFIPAFGQSLTAFDEAQISALKPQFERCWQENRKIMQAFSKQGDRASAVKYQQANHFMTIVLRLKIPEKMADSLPKVLSHQKLVLMKRIEAQQAVTAHLAQAKVLPPSESNIQAVNRMKELDFVANLDVTQRQDYQQQLTNIASQMSGALAKQHIASLDEFAMSLEGLEAFIGHWVQSRGRNHRTRRVEAMSWELQQAVHAKLQQLSEAAITDAVGQLEAFPSSLEGLRALTAFQQRVSIALQQAKAMGSYRFNKAYKVRLDEIAKEAVDEFEDLLNDYPVTQTHLKTVQNAVSRLFVQQPLPSNIADFQRIAETRAEQMQSQLVKQTCYGSIASEQIDEDERDTGLLAGSGASTLGLFICALKEKGYTLLDFEPPGFLGNTHVLTVKTPRGISLVMELQPVEVNKGESLLVGTSVMDASETQTFTLTQWQNYVSQTLRLR